VAFDMAPLQAHCDLDSAAALAALGRHREAGEALSRGMEGYRALGMVAHARRAEAVLASRF